MIHGREEPDPFLHCPAWLYAAAHDPDPFLDDFQGRDPVHPVLPVVGAHTPVAVHPRSGAPVFLPQ